VFSQRLNSLQNIAGRPIKVKATPIILASSSEYRKGLLARLGMSFICNSPNIDETPLKNEDIESLVVRLACQKADKTARLYSQGIVIGSDQAAVVTDHTGNQVLLGKPGNAEQAERQLSLCSAQTVTFKTGLCVLNIKTQQRLSCCEMFKVNFRPLTKQQIKRYIDIEQPFDCAGSFKCEGLGIRLFESLDGRDPNSLIGLPLIALIDFLLEMGIDPLEN